jgi:hypothetical protein
MSNRAISRVVRVCLLAFVGLGFGSQQTSSGSTLQSSQINTSPLTSPVIGPPPTGASASVSAPGNSPAPEYVPGELLVKMRPGVTVDTANRKTSSASFTAFLADADVLGFKPMLVLPDGVRM